MTQKKTGSGRTKIREYRGRKYLPKDGKFKTSEAYRKWRRQYAKKHRDEENKASREWRKKNRLRVTGYRYGVPYSTVKTLFDEAKGCCQICGNEGDRCFGLDHDHKTGKARGVLCSACNRGLGFFKDRSSLLIRAALYLRKLL